MGAALVGAVALTFATGALASQRDSTVAAAPSLADGKALREAVHDPEARRFYDRRSWRLAWQPNDATQLRATLAAAARHGMDASRFLEALGKADGREQQDAAYSEAALTYGAALAFGLVDPEKVHGIYTLPESREDLAAGLEDALQRGAVGGWLEGLAPQDPQYTALSSAYLEARSAIPAVARETIPAGALIRPGDQDPRIAQIAAVLHKRGYLPRRPRAGTYGPALVDAVRALQDDAGIARDGVIGPEVLDRLNSGPSARARQLAANLERLRWLERQPPETRIDVNIAAADLTYYRHGTAVDERRVVVGSQGHETPLIEAKFERLVVNPPWRVPQSIARAEILPKGSGYLRRHNMYVDDGQVVQRPSPSSALGVVKFDLDDPYAIYLHDTPSKSLFGRNERHRSHGCVRVEDAVGFARRIADDNGVRAEFDRDLASGETRSVRLPQAIPVRLLYLTAFADSSGRIVYRPDVYGWDRELERRLGLAREREGRRRALAADVGP